MKKKIIAICLCVALVAVGIVGATLAYFTDTDNATNTFTVGKVKIDLIEQQRAYDEKGEVTGLVDFVDGKALKPIVGSAQGVKDKYGMSTAKNYVDKIVTVKNLEEDAYVRVYIAVPAALVSEGSASQDVVHWNWGNKTSPKGDYAQAGQASGQQNAPDYAANMGELVTLAGTTKIDGIDYKVYYQTYKKVLTKDEVTGSAFMAGLYLDKNVDYKGEYTIIDENVGMVDGQWPTKTVYTYNGEEIDFDFTNGVKIPVFAIGAQAEGFTDADTAINAAFGTDYNPWAE